MGLIQLVIAMAAVLGALGIFATGELGVEDPPNEQAAAPEPPELVERLIAVARPGWYDDEELPLVEHYFDGKIWLATRWKGFPQLLPARNLAVLELLPGPTGPRSPVVAGVATGTRTRQRATVVLFVVAICAGVVITGGVLQLMS